MHKGVGHSWDPNGTPFCLGGPTVFFCLLRLHKDSMAPHEPLPTFPTRQQFCTHKRCFFFTFFKIMELTNSIYANDIAFFFTYQQLWNFVCVCVCVFYRASLILGKLKFFVLAIERIILHMQHLSHIIYLICKETNFINLEYIFISFIFK